MMQVKTLALASEIQGLGCFLAEDVAAGTVLWRYTDGYDRSFTVEEFNSLPTSIKEHMERYSYLCKLDGVYVYCCDNAKFFNHSDTPNTNVVGYDTVAARDLKAGEELTTDYREFCKEE